MARPAFGGRFGTDPGERDAAWERAEDLLRTSLTPEQLSTYERHGFVEVASRLHPGRSYRIDGWRPVAVFSSSGEFQGAICLRPRENLPAPDVIVAQKLYIEGAEEEFLASGNWLSPAWRPTSALPTIILVFFLIGPWLVNLLRLGPPGLLLALAGSLVLASWSVRRVLRPGGRGAEQANPAG